MNVGEYGLTHNVNVNYDISGNTSLTLVYTLPNGTTFVATGSDVALGASALTTPNGVFPANQYCRYVFKSGDLSVAGNYTARLIYTDSSKRLISDRVSFSVS